MTKVLCPMESCIYQHSQGYCILEEITLTNEDGAMEYPYCENYRSY